MQSNKKTSFQADFREETDVAEAVGFEPTDRFFAGLPDFESRAKVYTAPHIRAAAFMTATPSAARASGFGLQKGQGSSSLADFPFLHFFLPDFLPFSEFGKTACKKT